MVPSGRLRAQRASRLLLTSLVVVLALAACGKSDSDTDPHQVDALQPPDNGACRVLTPTDVADASNATRTVPCTSPHTAETFAVGDLPPQFAKTDYDDPSLGAWAYDTCSTKFVSFLGADDSLVMRTVLTWAWFRPSRSAWDKGARWYRCDAVGGGDQSPSYVDLPTSAQGLMQGRLDDHWLVCAVGKTVNSSPKVPCSEPHDWRAVTTIKLGETDDPYPGDRLSEVRTRDYCSKSVGAWLGYPIDYDFGYTFFHKAEWDAGNRRSVCWAKTDK